MAPEIIDRKLHVDGYIYLRSRAAKSRVYWDCRLLRGRTCTARAITSDPAEGGQLQLYKGLEESKHSHLPNREEVATEVLTRTLKRKAVDNPAEPPARLLRTELQGATSDILSQLPTQPALLRTIRRTWAKNVPVLPRKLSKLRAIPDGYQQMVLGEWFLFFDSGPPDEEEDESDEEVEEAGVQEEAPEPPQTIIFATHKNIELLCESSLVHGWDVQDVSGPVCPGFYNPEITTMNEHCGKKKGRCTSFRVCIAVREADGKI